MKILFKLTVKKYYEPLTGFMYNKNGKQLKSALNNKTNHYHQISVNNKHYAQHRFIWEYFNGKIPEDLFIDHINGNKIDNKLQNMRLVTRSQNQQNQPFQKHNRLKILGVTKQIVNNITKYGRYSWVRYMVQRTINGKRYAKRFKTELAAANYSNYLTHQIKYSESAGMSDLNH